MTQHENRTLRHTIVRRQLQVQDIVDLTPHMRRLVLGGPELTGFHSASPDDHIKMFFPNPDGVFITPVMGPNGPEPQLGATPSPMRDYTPRLHDADAGTLTVDFVLHGDGPASTWAATARVGDRIVLGGPRASFVPADDYDHYVLIGDETALPAIGRWLSEMPAGRKTSVLIEIPEDADRQTLQTQADAHVTWLARNGKPAHTSRLLENALEELQIQGDAFWWIACESRRARAMRKFLEEKRNVHKQWIRSTGYWKHDNSTDEDD